MYSNKLSLSDINEKCKIPRIIWMLWLQGYKNAPFLVQKCYESVKSRNPDWTIVLLDEQNVRDFISLDSWC